MEWPPPDQSHETSNKMASSPSPIRNLFDYGVCSAMESNGMERTAMDALEKVIVQ